MDHMFFLINYNSNFGNKKTKEHSVNDQILLLISCGFLPNYKNSSCSLRKNLRQLL